MEDLVGELLPQVEEHVVREDAGDGQVVRARVTHHELYIAHQRDILHVLRRESHLPSIRREYVSGRTAVGIISASHPELEGVVVRAR